MELPLIHLNGTSREALVEANLAAARAVREAVAALGNAAPNARDYYPRGPASFQRASAEHEDRMRRLRSVGRELEELAAAIENEDGGQSR